MTADEGNLKEQKVIDDGYAAQRILGDEVFKAAVADARAKILKEWETGETTEKRERAHAKLSALAEVLDALGAKQQSGVLTEHRAKLKGRTRH